MAHFFSQDDLRLDLDQFKSRKAVLLDRKKKISTWFSSAKFKKFFLKESLRRGESAGLELLEGLFRGNPRCARLPSIDQMDPRMDEIRRQAADWLGQPCAIDVFYALKKSVDHIHRDPLDKFLIQFEGTGIIEFNKTERKQVALESRLLRRPGDVVFIPKGLAHRHIISNSKGSVFAPLWINCHRSMYEQDFSASSSSSSSMSRLSKAWDLFAMKKESANEFVWSVRDKIGVVEEIDQILYNIKSQPLRNSLSRLLKKKRFNGRDVLNLRHQRAPIVQAIVELHSKNVIDWRRLK